MSVPLNEFSQTEHTKVSSCQIKKQNITSDITTVSLLLPSIYYHPPPTPVTAILISTTQICVASFCTLCKWYKWNHTACFMLSHMKLSISTVFDLHKGNFMWFTLILCVCVCFLSPSLNFYLWESSMLMCVAVHHSYESLYDITLCDCTTISLFIDGHLHSFWYLAIMNNTRMKILISDF